MGRGRRSSFLLSPPLPASTLTKLDESADLWRLFPEGRPLGDSWEQQEYRSTHCHYLALALSRRFGLGLAVAEGEPRVLALAASGDELWAIDVGGRRRLAQAVVPIDCDTLAARAAELGLSDPTLDYALADAVDLLERYLAER
jgi:hypothetical protein